MGKHLVPRQQLRRLPLNNLLPQLMSLEKRPHSSDQLQLTMEEISNLLRGNQVKYPGLVINLKSPYSGKMTTCWSLDSPCPFCEEWTLHRSSRKMWCTHCEASWEVKSEGEELKDGEPEDDS